MLLGRNRDTPHRAQCMLTGRTRLVPAAWLLDRRHGCNTDAADGTMCPAAACTPMWHACWTPPGPGGTRRSYKQAGRQLKAAALSAVCCTHSLGQTAWTAPVSAAQVSWGQTGETALSPP
jgi:hypothetical protein